MSRESLDKRLEAIVGPRWVSARPEHLRAYGRDAWPRTYLLAREGVALKTPELVVWPGRLEELVRLVKLCAEVGVPMIPYGAGSGVCGGVHALHGGVTVSLERFDTIGPIEPLDRLVRVGAGVIGQHLEDALGRQGYTAGHFPSSIQCSSVGGWVAGRGAGQCSSRYGKIEDIVAGMTLVDGRGEVHHFAPRPRLGLGPDPLHLIVGSEGVLGFIPELTLRVRRRARHRRMRGLLMPTVGAGLRAIQRIFAAGHRPFVARLYDPLDTTVNKGKGTGTAERRLPAFLGRGLSWLKGQEPIEALLRQAMKGGLHRPALLNRAVDALGKQALLILGSEGADPSLVEHELAECLVLAAEAGGDDLGPAPGEHWLEHRHAVSYKLSPMLSLGAFVDTMEVATTWERLLPLYERVRRAVADEAFVMAHFSHAYEDGASIYFTFAGWAPELASREAAYDRTWQKALSAVREGGGTLSHHHGVGMSKQAFLRDELGEGGMKLLRGLKDALDPAGLANPGKLGLGEGPSLPGGAAALRAEVRS
ncbi:MAG: FAD-binding oxidoreductase [Deltaproteobacteria bacterium]|nr:FAD-binding oxidoreductase [Deltaproteobacteria bacterium]